MKWTQVARDRCAVIISCFLYDPVRTVNTHLLTFACTQTQHPCNFFFFKIWAHAVFT